MVSELRRFIAAYGAARGEYKRLRTAAPAPGAKTWDILRNRALSQLKEKHADAKLFNEKDEPTSEHLEMLLWAHSPDAARVKKLLPETKEDARDGRKRGASGGEDSHAKKARD